MGSWGEYNPTFQITSGLKGKEKKDMSQETIWKDELLSLIWSSISFKTSSKSTSSDLFLNKLEKKTYVDNYIVKGINTVIQTEIKSKYLKQCLSRFRGLLDPDPDVESKKNTGIQKLSC